MNLARALCFAAAAAGLACACAEEINLAVGPAGDVTIFSELPEESPELAILRDTLEQQVVVIKPEPAFKVELARPEGFKLRRNWRNLVFLGSLDSDPWIAAKAEELLGPERFRRAVEGERNLFFFRDTWALGQLVMLLVAPDRESLAKVVKDNAERIYEALETATIENTKRIMIKKGVQRDTAEYLERNYGWSLLVPEYFEVTEDKGARIVLFRAEEPSRMIFVHWEEHPGGNLSPEECLSARGRIAWSIYDGDYIAKDMTHTKETTFAGRKAIKIVGLWQNDKYNNGGPFRTYCFLDKGDLYLVDLVVFAPAFDKLPYLRQLEAIARTFEIQ